MIGLYLPPWKRPVIMAKKSPKPQPDTHRPIGQVIYQFWRNSDALSLPLSSGNAILECNFFWHQQIDSKDIVNVVIAFASAGASHLYSWEYCLGMRFPTSSRFVMIRICLEANSLSRVSNIGVRDQTIKPKKPLSDQLPKMLTVGELLNLYTHRGCL